MLRILFLLWALLAIPYFGFAASFIGKVVKVSDGDTTHVLKDGKAVKIRSQELTTQR